jgi:hypothetical protein
MVTVTCGGHGGQGLGLAGSLAGGSSLVAFGGWLGWLAGGLAGGWLLCWLAGWLVGWVG